MNKKYNNKNSKEFEDSKNPSSKNNATNKGGSRSDKRGNRRNNTSNSGNNNINRNNNKSAVADDPHARNDLSWYAPTPEMLIASCSLPFSDKLSNTTDLGIYKVLTPGVANLKLETSICSGKSITNMTEYYTDDAINTVAKNIYSYIRRANSGAKTYEAVDLMQYLLTCDQAFMLWSWLVRAYGIARAYQYSNTYYPKVILQAMGFKSPEYISNNLAQLNFVINELAVRMSNLAVPKLPYFMRHMWLYQNIFLDRPNRKAQSFMFNPNSYYTYVEKTDTALPYLQRHDWPELNLSPLTYTDLTNLINSILDPIVQSETLADTIPGDIIKAYGEENLFKFAQLPLDYIITPIYAEEIMPEISNAVILNHKAGDIKQTASNYLYQSIDINATYDSHEFISLTKEMPTPEDVMYATRLIPVQRAAKASDGIPAKVSTGSEYVYQIDVYYGTNGVLTIRESHPTIPFTISGNTTGSTVQPIIDLVKQAYVTSAFDWFPRTTVNDRVAGDGIHQMLVNMDMDNYTKVDFDTVDRIHQTAFAGLFGLAYTLFKG